jgi:hypothetical protein
MEQSCFKYCGSNVHNKFVRPVPPSKKAGGVQTMHKVVIQSWFLGKMCVSLQARHCMFAFTMMY